MMDSDELLERIYQATKDSAHAALLYNSEKWMALVITNEMIRNKEQPVYISVDMSSGEPSEDTKQLKEKIKTQFPRFGGFDNIHALLVHLKNAGWDRFDLESYPEELQFIQGVVDDVWRPKQ